jgi:hypothetical protein
MCAVSGIHDAQCGIWDCGSRQSECGMIYVQGVQHWSIVIKVQALVITAAS